MANLATLKAALNAAIYQNNQNAITGEALNTILNSIIDTLGTGYRYAGVATPSANPGTIDNRVFYLATAAGTYTNFGAVQLDGKSLHVFIYDTTWHDVALDVPTTDALAVLQGSGTNSVVGLDPAAGATGDGSVCLGRTYGDGGELSANGDGSIVEGTAGTDEGEQSTAILQANADGASVSGFAYSKSGLYAGLISEYEGSHAEGCAQAYQNDSTISAGGLGSHAEGYSLDSYIAAEEDGSHAEGRAEGGGNIRAGGKGSHAEGYAELGDILATGDGSHAEGVNTQASGKGSHAEGIGTIAEHEGEHAAGKFNLTNQKTTGTPAEQAAGTTLSSVGCGTSANDRKNAVEVMQNGDFYIKGVGGYDGANPASPGVGPINKLLNYAIFFASPDESPRNWAGQPIVVAANEYAFVVVTDKAKRTTLFSQYLQDALENAGVSSPRIDNCLYIGCDGATVFDSSNLLESGDICCIYYNDPTDEFYFIEYEV